MAFMYDASLVNSGLMPVARGAIIPCNNGWSSTDAGSPVPLLMLWGMCNRVSLWLLQGGNTVTCTLRHGHQLGRVLGFESHGLL
jgi:hypothetical protein